LQAAAAAAPKDAGGLPRAEALVVGAHGATIGKQFAQLVTQLGWDDVSPHTCRHTWASLALQNGVDIYSVAKTMGDTVKTVEQTYGKVTTESLRSAVDWRERVA
jgi:site-specific recombinase XerD